MCCLIFQSRYLVCFCRFGLLEVNCMLYHTEMINTYSWRILWLFCLFSDGNQIFMFCDESLLLHLTVPGNIFISIISCPYFLQYVQLLKKLNVWTEHISVIAPFHYVLPEKCYVCHILISENMVFCSVSSHLATNIIRYVGTHIENFYIQGNTVKIQSFWKFL